MSLLPAIQRKAAELKPTAHLTVVRPHPCICTGTEAFGMGALGGALEREREEPADTTIITARAAAAKLSTSRHAVVYTGAGVSTATGISDYRGPKGVWSCLATGRIPDDSFDISSAQPSFTHMAIKALVDRGLIKHVTSTNLDGLHLKSGLSPLENLSELHGSMWYERCMRCRRDSPIRPFPVRRGTQASHPRHTGRWCACGGAFMDSGIDFGQSLPLHHLSLAEKHSKLSDFSLVVGTSMPVAPASTLPLVLGGVPAVPNAKEEELWAEHCTEDGSVYYVNAETGESVWDKPTDSSAKKKELCIVNLMETPADDQAQLRAFCKADLFFFHLMAELEIEVPVPPVTSQWLRTATHMKRLATKHLPDHRNQYVGSAQREAEMATALLQVEAELIAGGVGSEGKQAGDGAPYHVPSSHLSRICL